MATGRVADEDDALRVEWVALDQLVHERHRGGHVHAGAGPLAVDVAAASVLDVPGRDPGLPKGDAEMAGVDQVVRRLPRTAVHDDRERK